MVVIYWMKGEVLVSGNDSEEWWVMVSFGSGWGEGVEFLWFVF